MEVETWVQREWAQRAANATYVRMGRRHLPHQGRPKVARSGEPSDSRLSRRAADGRARQGPELRCATDSSRQALWPEGRRSATARRSELG